MKKLMILALLCISTVAAHAQKVTKVTASASTTGTVVLEDTSGTGTYAPFRRGDLLPVVTGTTAANAKLSFYSKTNKALIYQVPINAVFVVGAVGTPSTQTLSNKIAFLKANTY